MSLRLKRSVKAFLGTTLAVMLAAVMLALSPTIAEAHTEDRSTSSVVVRPGDSLWSISGEQLAPNATPQRILKGTEQIYTLNRARIGADPNLIFAGQELLVPPAMSKRPTEATPGHRTVGNTTGPAEGTTGKAPRMAAGGGDAKDSEASAPVADREAEPAPLPDDAAAAPVPAVRMVASNDSTPSLLASFLSTVRSTVATAASAVTAVAGSFVSSFAEVLPDGRRLLGLGVWLLTLVVVALMAWKLPMRRVTREDAERWGIPTGYYYGAQVSYRNVLFTSRQGSPGDRGPEAAWREEATKPLGNASAAAPRRLRNPIPKAKATPRNGLALGAHYPEVRSAALQARSLTRTRKPRPRRRAARRLVSATDHKRGGEPS